jgi:hypothetical protein
VGSGVKFSQKQQYAVTPDGQRFLINITADESAASPSSCFGWTLSLDSDPFHSQLPEFDLWDSAETACGS